MNDSLDLRRMVYGLVIVAAAGMALGRILSAELVSEPSLSRSWPDDPKHPRRAWPETAPRAMPTFSSNDRSRWATVRALVDEGTWAIGRRDRKTGKDSGIVFEDGWQSVDKMLNPKTLEFYSTKPPLLTCLVAGEYWLLKKTFGWTLSGESDHRFAVVRVCLLTFNLLPFLVYLWLLSRLADRFGATDWGRLFVVTAACFATSVTPFLISLNNHTLATCSVVLAVYATVRILSANRQSPLPGIEPYPAANAAGSPGEAANAAGSPGAAANADGSPGAAANADGSPGAGWRWFVLAGFFAGFTAVNELPAAAFTVGLGLLLLPRFPKKTLLAFAPAALLPVAALTATNYAELGEIKPAYSKFGTPWYEYEGSHWKNLPDQSKRGIDWAKNRETKGAYAFHLLVGHHGWFSLTPLYVLALAGMGLAAWRLLVKTPPHLQPLSPDAGGRGENGSSPHSEGGENGSPRPPEGGERLGVRGANSAMMRLWAELAIATAFLSSVVIGYYIYKSDNYGGWSNGPRWLMWLSPLWLLTLLPIVDRLAARRWGRMLGLVLLALSVVSAHYTDWNPWRHPWIYNWMDERGQVPY